MVSFSNMDGAHCDSVVDHYTLPSNSIQMDVKVPVQPSNFDPLQKGALMGASTFMEQDKNHSNQCNYKTKSIPSPGTTYSENPAYGWVFAFLRPTANRRPDKHSAIRHSMPIVFTFNFSHRLFITNAGLQFGCDILH